MNDINTMFRNSMCSIGVRLRFFVSGRGVAGGGIIVKILSIIMGCGLWLSLVSHRF